MCARLCVFESVCIHYCKKDQQNNSNGNIKGTKVAILFYSMAIHKMRSGAIVIGALLTYRERKLGDKERTQMAGLPLASSNVKTEHQNDWQ